MSKAPFPTLRRLPSLVAPLLLVSALAAGCGGEAEDDSAQEATPSASVSSSPTEAAEESPEQTPQESGQRLEVSFEAGTYSPLGERVEVSLDEPVVLVVTADAAGSLHVHSTPEQEVEFEAGTSEHELTFSRPGVVEVESHDPDLVVLQLEVR